LRVDDDAKPCGSANPDERFPPSGLKVLVVDDDANICQSLKDLLESRTLLH
jgi:hypothetical protein